MAKQTNFDKVCNTAAWMRKCGWNKTQILGAFEAEDQGILEENWEYIELMTGNKTRVANERSLSVLGD